MRGLGNYKPCLKRILLATDVALERCIRKTWAGAASTNWRQTCIHGSKRRGRVSRRAQHKSACLLQMPASKGWVVQGLAATGVLIKEGRFSELDKRRATGCFGGQAGGTRRARGGRCLPGTQRPRRLHAQGSLIRWQSLKAFDRGCCDRRLHQRD